MATYAELRERFKSSEEALSNKIRTKLPTSEKRIGHFRAPHRLLAPKSTVESLLADPLIPSILRDQQIGTDLVDLDLWFKKDKSQVSARIRATFSLLGNPNRFALEYARNQEGWSEVRVEKWEPKNITGSKREGSFRRIMSVGTDTTLNSKFEEILEQAVSPSNHPADCLSPQPLPPKATSASIVSNAR